MFGLAAVSPDFGAVKDIVGAAGGVTPIDINGRTVFAVCDLSFIAA